MSVPVQGINGTARVTTGPAGTVPATTGTATTGGVPLWAADDSHGDVTLAVAGEVAGAGLVVLAQASWPVPDADQPRPLPGFVVSSFSPLVAELAERCLLRYFGTRPADPARGGRTGVLLASVTGDVATAAAVAAAVDAGARVPPMLFYHSNPNAVVGYLTARWALTGPVVCTSPAGDAITDAVHCAVSLIEDGDADAVLIVVAEQGAGEATGTSADHGIALLIGPSSWCRRKEDDP